MWLKRIQRLLGVSPVIFREASSLSYSVRNTVVVFSELFLVLKLVTMSVAHAIAVGRWGRVSRWLSVPWRGPVWKQWPTRAYGCWWSHPPPGKTLSSPPPTKARGP